MKIHIGHGAYAGANRLTVCSTKTSAVAELMGRGIKRAKAREVIADVCSRIAGYATISATEYGESIEVCDRSRDPHYA